MHSMCNDEGSSTEDDASVSLPNLYFVLSLSAIGRGFRRRLSFQDLGLAI